MRWILIFPLVLLISLGHVRPEKTTADDVPEKPAKNDKSADVSPPENGKPTENAESANVDRSENGKTLVNPPEAVKSATDIVGSAVVDSPEKVPEWPTPNHFSEDPAEWPGNGRPLGTDAPTAGAAIVRGFPSRNTFIERYFIPSVPLHMVGALKDSVAAKKWSDDKHYNSGSAALTFINTTVLDADDDGHLTVAKGTVMSFRTFFRRQSTDKTIGFEAAIPDFMRFDITLPVALQCRPIITAFQSAKLRKFARLAGTARFTVPTVDRMACAIGGTKSVLFVDPEQILRDSNHTVRIPEFTEKDFHAVDFVKYPALRFARFVRAQIEPNDCLYQPANWLQFESSTPGYFEVDMTWAREGKVESEKVCGDLGSAAGTAVALGMVNFRDDPAVSLMRMMALAPVQTLFEAVAGRRNFTFEQLEKWLKTEKHLLKKVVEWNDEYSELAGELFLLLDLNRDTVFSTADFDVLTSGTEALFLGRLEDRVQDFMDLMTDQQAEKGGGGLAAGGAGAKAGGALSDGVNAQTKEYMEKATEEMKRLVADAMEKISALNRTEQAGAKLDSGASRGDGERPERPKNREPRTDGQFDRSVETAQAASDASGGGRAILSEQEEPEEIMAEEDPSDQQSTDTVKDEL
ncbi:hypothetical protein BV898_02298 [Hypsibius exemplaris]|uniref:Cupin-like domain-containing protein n=1 Tax=Hypsibius exemplaris TaxID=2072580 RepID=A0A1W0X9L3_HYPEX|nr:hypothetical protein BV898_02298 [Hypsibius exemplaris]